MTQAVTIGFVRGTSETVLVAPAHAPLAGQQAAMKALRASRTHPRFERVELWTNNNGRVSMVRFNQPTAESAPEPSAPTVTEPAAPSKKSK